MDTDYTREQMLNLAVQSAGNSGYSTEGILQNAQRLTDFVKLSKKERKRRSKLSEGKVDMAREQKLIGFDDLHPEVVVALHSLSEAVDQLQGQTLDRLAQVAPSPLKPPFGERADAARFAAEMEGTEGFPEQESVPQEKDNDVTALAEPVTVDPEWLKKVGWNEAIDRILAEGTNFSAGYAPSLDQVAQFIKGLRK